MHGDAYTDPRINMLESGLEKIASSISEMRNKDSDAHGVGAVRINIDEHHAWLFVNAAMTMADFILSFELKANQENTYGNQTNRDKHTFWWSRMGIH